MRKRSRAACKRVWRNRHNEVKAVSYLSILPFRAFASSHLYEKGLLVSHDYDNYRLRGMDISVLTVATLGGCRHMLLRPVVGPSASKPSVSTSDCPLIQLTGLASINRQFRLCVGCQYLQVVPHHVSGLDPRNVC